MIEAAVCLANEMVGGADRLREDALAYAKMRMQFGKPIASFQSMKHKQADMLLEVELAKSAAYYAAAALDEGDDDVAASAHLAKALRQRGLHADRHPCGADPWRHRLHLGQRHASLVQAGQKLRGVAGRCQLSPRTDDAELGGLRASDHDRDQRRLRVRAEVRAWLEANWNPDYGLVEWRHKLAESGWGVPHWPSRWYGRDLPVGLVPVVEEEFKRIGAIGVAKAGIRTLAAATILAHGTDLHKEKFLLRILTGEDTWCQLFSEPGSGSDVAGAVTRAEFRGNNGWSTARRSGPPARTRRIGACCWRAPTGTSRSTRACPTSSST